MEKKIKILYSLTIIAILTFLGMQIYWLYLRYDNSLREYEDNITAKVEEILLNYKMLRAEHMNDNNLKDQTSRTIFNMDLKNDSSHKSIMTANIKNQKYYAHEILGIKEKRKLTMEEQLRVAEMINDSIAAVETVISSFDASSAPDEGAVWSGMKNVQMEMKSPFTTMGVDSLFRKAGIEEVSHLIVTDSMEWKPTIIRHSKLINPEIKFSVPYSELEKKSVVVVCPIPIEEVMKEMGLTLIVSLGLSVLLILCLVWQFSTIMKLTRLDKMRNMFLTTMIHELKRPIGTLMMCVAGIENEKMLADKEIRNELTSNTRTALDNLSAYFSKLRDITFNNVEQIPLNITKFNLNKLVNDVKASLIIPSYKTVKIENGVGEDVEISADRTHVFNIVNNLLENAIKYSGENVEIKVDSVIDENGISIMVTDNGEGISETEQRHVFTRFFRGKRSASGIPGMGLGLTYVKLLTEAHSGIITVKSKLGQGSTFSIFLPQ